MPLCEGRPNEPCPCKAFGSLSQADLILYKDCKEFCFPSLKAARQRKVKDKIVHPLQSTRTRGSVNQHIEQENSAKTGGIKSHSDPGCSALSDRESSTSFAGVCLKCYETVDSTCILCDICHDYIHSTCTGLSEDVYNIICRERYWLGMC